MKENKFYVAAAMVVEYVLDTGLVQSRYKRLYKAAARKFRSFTTVTPFNLMEETAIELRPIDWVVLMDVVIHACDQCLANSYCLSKDTVDVNKAVQNITVLLMAAAKCRDESECAIDALDWASGMPRVNMQTAAMLHCELQNNNW